MKRVRLTLKRAQVEPPLSLAAATGPVFALLDPPGVYDRDGDRMGAENLRLPDGHSDVPLYWIHGHKDEDSPARIPVGRALVWREGAQWYMQPQCDGVDELSRTVAAKVDVGTIAACSIGYITHAAAPNGAGPRGLGEDVLEGELVEVSLVGIGAKAGAVRVKKMAISKTAKAKWKSAEDAQAGMEQMAADVASCKEQLAKLLTMMEAMAPEEQDEEPGEGEEEAEPETKDGAAEPDEETTAVAKWLKELTAKAA